MGNWPQLCTEVQDLVWEYCGDLRNISTRRHKFVGLEIKLWGIIVGHPVAPSELLKNYGYVGINNLKNTLKLAYLQAQGEALLEYHRGRGTP